MAFNDDNFDNLTEEEITQLYNSLIDDPDSTFYIADCSCTAPGSGMRMAWRQCDSSYCHCYFYMTSNSYYGAFDTYCSK